MDSMMMGAMSKSMESMPDMQMMDMSVVQACMDACMQMRAMVMASA